MTRERIRQIEGKILADLDGLRCTPRAAPLRHLAGRLGAALGPMTWPEPAWDAARALANGSSSHQDDDELALRSSVLVALARPYEPTAGILMTPAARWALREDEQRVARLAPDAVVDGDELAGLLSLAGTDADVRHRLIDHLRLRPFGSRLLNWRGTQADRAVSILGAHGDVLGFTDLHGQIGPHISPRSLADGLRRDARIVRDGQGAYGLLAWEDNAPPAP